MEFKLPSLPWQQEVIYHEKQSRQFCGLHCINNLFQRKVYSKQQMDSIADEMYQKELALYQDENNPNSRVLLANSHRSSMFLLFELCHIFLAIVFTIFSGSFGNYSFEVIYEALHRLGFEMTKLIFQEQTTTTQFETMFYTDTANCIGFIICGPTLINKKKTFNPFQHLFQKQTPPKYSAGGHWFCISKQQQLQPLHSSSTTTWVHHDSHFKKPTCFDDATHLQHYLYLCATHFNAQIWKIHNTQ